MTGRRGGSEIRTIPGRYAFVPNPCTTVPCLPGMAYALQAGEELFFVTVGGQLLSESRAWGTFTPRPGDEVTIAGPVQERVDAFGRLFRVIEARSLTLSR